MIRNPKWPRYWPDKVVINLATMGSVGKLPAPGTWGSLVGFLLYLVLFYSLSPFWYVAMIVATCYFAIGICGEAEKRLKKVDPGEVVIDEVVAIPICFFGLQPFMGQSYTWMVFIAVFALFRFFDILKPLGIKKLQRYYGGFGVVIDDVVAGTVVSLILNIGLRVWQHYGM